eukprot:TRINITY_DN1110_c0_g1_i2.p1 TRINITY_DN1110_c0_g1~~TRINITY_DN1110_c0_g1_i2.p1  ORF type:complete len:301 (+),score=45.17 TRINITY_DN1110_c0_g1_i2:1046-1948(+)
MCACTCVCCVGRVFVARACLLPAGVVVTTADGRTYTARYLVNAAPPALVAKIAHEPPLPVGRAAVCDEMKMGCVIKCLVFYTRSFWRELGLSGDAFGSQRCLSAVFEASKPGVTPYALVGFIVGSSAVEWSAKSQEERKQAVLQDLARLFKTDAALDCCDYHDKDWMQEEFSTGCYLGLMPPGLMTKVGTALREPVGRIHWAGTETAREGMGYFDGAAESGGRAALEVYTRLRSESPAAPLPPVASGHPLHFAKLRSEGRRVVPSVASGTSFYLHPRSIASESHPAPLGGNAALTFAHLL